MNNNNHSEPKTETIAETDNFHAWLAEEPDGETTYYLQVGRATINFFQEEWDQFLELVRAIDDVKPDDDQLYRLEFDNVDVWMDEEDWREFKNLAREISK
jgi:hypothetical protein